MGALMLGAAPIQASITPAIFIGGASNVQSSSGAHTASVSAGVPSSYTWSVVSGNGFIDAGQGTATATLRVVDNGLDDGAEVAVFQCDVVVNGITYSAQCSRSKRWIS